MVIKLDENKNFIHIIEATKLELDQIKYSFTKKLDNWFIIKKKNPSWNCEISFIDTLHRIPFGLWKELLMVCREFGFNLQIIGGSNVFLNNDFDENDFKRWVKEFFYREGSKMHPRDYQLQGVIKALKYKRCLEEISTSGGKTFMIFMIFQYLYDRGLVKQMLMIVPNIGLITQAEEDFLDYAEKVGYDPEWKSECVYGGSKKKNTLTGNIIFGTYQSLCKKDAEYFKTVDGLVVDECLHPDSLIKMCDGTEKKISEVKEGDMVYTINDITNEIEICPVDYVYHNLSKGQDMYEIEMEDGTILKITGNHKVLLENNTWARVDSLNGDENIISLNRFNLIKNIKKINYKEDVYNLRIKTDKETNHNYFANGLCVSNCHHSQNTSIRNIITKCFNTKYKLGFSGTLPKQNTCDSFTIQSYIGPCVHKLTSAELINNKNATPVKVECYELDYLSNEIKNKLFQLRSNKKEGDGTKLLNLERSVMRENRTRLIFLCNKIMNVKNNSLVLFSDVQGQYGRKIFNHLKEHSEYIVYYIDGSTTSENRDYYKAQMEENDNIILVASIGTFSEGISIKNLHNIFLAECGKSEIITAQILGRGMRLLSGKDSVTVYDFIDNYIFGKGTFNATNYLYKHGMERQKMYEQRKFPYTIIKVNLSNSFANIL